MYLRLLFKFILVIALVIFQIAFISATPVWLRELNLIIVFLVLSLEWSGGYKTIWWFLLIGLLYDIYFPLRFGFFIILWPMIFLFAAFLAKNFFTNRSLYSFLGITFFATVFYYLVYNVSFYFADFFSGGKSALFLLVKNFWLRLGDGLIVNILAVIILFYSTNLISDRLKPVFIIKK
jgi:cell shape-determining protein MreD